MPRYSVGFFIISEAHYDELRRVEVEAERALATNQLDDLWRVNQIFRRAHEVATVSEIISGESEPLVDDSRDTACVHLSIWIKQRFLGGDDRHVLDAEQFAMMARRLREISQEEILQWSTANASKYREVSPPLVAELFDALQRAVRAAPAGPHGFVYSNFRHEYADPPEPEPIPEPTMSPADGRKAREVQIFRIEAAIRRGYDPWWASEAHEEARVLVGLLAPERVDELGEAYEAAMDRFKGDEVRAGLAALAAVIPRVEAALLDPLIEAVGGPVEALRWLRARLRKELGEYPAAVYSLEQAVELDELLERCLDDTALEWIHDKEVRWTRAVVEETCERFRAALRRAIATGHGFVWLVDEYRDRPDYRSGDEHRE